MRDLIKLIIVGIVILFAPIGFCADKKYKLVILPDNIVTESLAVDSFIYDSASEFFSTEVINLLNQTDFINCPTVSNERQLLKSTPATMIPARDVTQKFKTTYNVDLPKLKKLTNKNQTHYAALITSTIDAENYVLRRTLWDFLNIAGATVIDPAYKISTYVVLIDTNTNGILWSNTFYKTISTVESRILTRGPSPQTEQLQKIRDYSRMLCPEIAYNLQKYLLSDADYIKETHKIYYDMGDFDNIFTKKYRRWRREGKKDFNATKSNVKNTFKKKPKQRIQEETTVKKSTKAEITNTVKQETSKTKIQSDKPTKIIQPLDFEDQSLFEPVNIRKTRKNKLIEDEDVISPLRGYDKL